MLRNFVKENHTDGFFLEEKEEVLRDHHVVTMEECENLLNTIGVYDGETDKLQWSVVYNLTDRTGRIWPHRDSGKSWDFTVVQSY